jgi:hypothetical protein
VSKGEEFDPGFVAMNRCYLCGHHENIGLLETVTFEGAERDVHRMCRYTIEQYQRAEQDRKRAEEMNAAWFAEVERSKRIHEQDDADTARIIKLLESIDRTLQAMDGRQP